MVSSDYFVVLLKLSVGRIAINRADFSPVAILSGETGVELSDCPATVN